MLKLLVGWPKHKKLSLDSSATILGWQLCRVQSSMIMRMSSSSCQAKLVNWMANRYKENTCQPLYMSKRLHEHVCRQPWTNIHRLEAHCCMIVEGEVKA